MATVLIEYIISLENKQQHNKSINWFIKHNFYWNTVAGKCAIISEKKSSWVGY